ncbi:ABC transporter substrate-binding protein [Paenibacillus harenae]|uniref:Aldouronate transport system substrate-binding protein n=1 Tax=Paenibacillus harenae TaxID=306543 RepID=A0ABT9U6M2_PAEHA|nr:ABC transporter substrate-binding protein [Paenibacillus harenae]MDQ0115273.1 putative aldouronate transport system substrate-binding protein [Paenibacillus harenae]
MQKKKSFMLLFAIIMVLTTVLSACGSKNNENPGNSSETTNKPATDATEQQAGDGKADTSEEVKIKMLLVGGKPIDYDLVFGELNKKLKEKANATVEAEFLDWSDWTQKYPLKFAANEDFDIAYTANWAFYSDQAIKGGFMELTDELIKANMPLSLAAMPAVAWEQSKVNGKQYMVPNNNPEVTDKAVLIREDLRKKHNLPEVNSPESFANYVKTIAGNEKGINAYNAKAADGWKWHELDQILLEQQNEWNLVDYSMPLAYKLDDATGKIFNVYDTPEFKALVTYYKDLADNNAWSKNVVSNKNDVWQDMKAGKTASYAHTLGTVAMNLAEMRREQPDVELAIADLTPDKKKIAAISTQNGFAIHATSKKAERSLMVIDLLQNDKEIHDLFMYGIAGTHYEAVGDDKFSATAGTPNYTGFSNWGANSPMNRKDAAYPVEADAIATAWQSKVYNFDLETFVFNDANVKNEVANVGNVMLRYAIPLEYGLIKDVEKGVADLNAQLKAAGIDKLQAELQSQIDAFLASK